jgi:hypothetical protein
MLLAVTVAAATAADPVLPAPLEIHYTLHYGALTVGKVVKSLQRDSDGAYQHHSRSRPEGMARLFTNVEWLEEGRFEIVAGRIRPLRFLEYRIGADKPHRHEAIFDWSAGQIRYDRGAVASLTASTQDQGSMLYALMLHPPTSDRAETIAISGGKKLNTYAYRDAGAQTLTTSIGRFKTRIVERVTRDKNDEGFRVWLATDYRNLPIRIATTKRGQDTVLELESVTGALNLPAAAR